MTENRVHSSTTDFMESSLCGESLAADSQLLRTQSWPPVLPLTTAVSIIASDQPLNAGELIDCVLFNAEATAQQPQ